MLLCAEFISAMPGRNVQSDRALYDTSEKIFEGDILASQEEINKYYGQQNPNRGGGRKGGAGRGRKGKVQV